MLCECGDGLFHKLEESLIHSPSPLSSPSQDTTFEFEKRRNRPVKYDRELMTHTLDAIARVQEIRKRRQDAFAQRRFQHARGVQKEETLREIARHVELIPDRELRERTKLKIRALAEEGPQALERLQEEEQRLRREVVMEEDGEKAAAAVTPQRRSSRRLKQAQAMDEDDF